MCGITGFLNVDGAPVSVMTLRRMTKAIAHRGPDGHGHYSDRMVALGHRRLAIIDLSPAGHQPMCTPDGRFVLTYNGEVYNFREIRRQLEERGRQFVSRTDSEVVLNAVAEWGKEALNRFNGMFAFALWDRKRQELFLARDRYGIKPLYYAKRGNTFAFGSEIKAILEHPEFGTELDKEALVEYFTFQNFFTDRTLFAGIRILPAGCWLRVPAGQSSDPKPVRYWDYQFEESDNLGDQQECLEELDRLFRQAVNRQLVSDVEVGAYLSGGMDSSSITAIAARQIPYLKTFTCGFDLNSASGLELGYDEREKAEYMSYLFKTEHYEMVLKAGDMERVLPRLVWHLEEPRVGQSYPNFYISQLVSKFVKVVLAGTGGDELFGGYPWRYYRAVVNEDFDEYIKKYYAYWQRLIESRNTREVFEPIWSDVQHVSTLDIFRNALGQPTDDLTTPEQYVNRSLYLEASTFLHGLLVVEDKLSMAHGLETRVPFLDNDLVDFAMRLPVRMKLANLDEVIRINENEPRPKMDMYFNMNRDGKLLLREMLKIHIPSDLSSIEKKGFSAPDASWFRGESLEYVRRKLLGDQAFIYEYMDRKAVQKLVLEHLEGKRNRRLLIWSLLSFEWWISKFLEPMILSKRFLTHCH